MRYIYIHLLLVVFCVLIGVNSSDIKDKVTEYFKNGIFKAFQKHWRAHRQSFENAILLALKENYGYRGMNIYIRRSADSLRLCTGFYTSDNVVELLLLDTTLSSLPYLTMPEVTFALASNVLRVEAGLSKMILASSYTLFRNQSDIVYAAVNQKSDKSPFSYVQVQPHGRLVVLAEDCTLVGFVLAKLNGLSVNLGHDTFRIRNCKFSIEISSNNPGDPPLIAPYFSTEQSKQLELLLTRPIRDELLPKLQAAVLTYVNASLIFGDYLYKFREYQNVIFKDTLKYIKEIVTGINSKTVETNQATLDLEPDEVFWKFLCPEGLCTVSITVGNVTIHGLDTLYPSHTGGPYKLQSPRIAEAIRFNSLMVRGSTVYENNNVTGNHDFVAEVHDISVDFEIDMEKSEPTFEVVNWRSFEFSITEIEPYEKYRTDLNAFIHGYLLNKLPILLEDHLRRMYKLVLESNQKLAAVPGNNTNCDNKRKD